MWPFFLLCNCLKNFSIAMQRSEGSQFEASLWQKETLSQKYPSQKKGWWSGSRYRH
jgi:hypothetical protein